MRFYFIDMNTVLNIVSYYQPQTKASGDYIKQCWSNFFTYLLYICMLYEACGYKWRNSKLILEDVWNSFWINLFLPHLYPLLAMNMQFIQCEIFVCNICKRYWSHLCIKGSQLCIKGKLCCSNDANLYELHHFWSFWVYNIKILHKI